MFRFPTDPSRRDAWVRAIRRENWKPNEYSVVCKLHFILEKPSRFPNNPDYVPSKFSFNTSSAVYQQDKLNRFVRLQARRKKQAELMEEEAREEGNEVANTDFEDDTDDSETQVDQLVFTTTQEIGTTQQTETKILEERILKLEEDLQKANEKVSNLEGSLAQANAAISSIQIRLTEATDKLHKSEEEKLLLTQELEAASVEKDLLFKLEEEKILLMQQLHQHSSIATKIRNDDKQTRFYTGLPSYDVFVLLVTHLSPHVSKSKSIGSGLTLADEFLVSLIKISRACTN